MNRISVLKKEMESRIGINDEAFYVVITCAFTPYGGKCVFVAPLDVWIEVEK